MKEYKCKFPISDRVKIFVEPNGTVYLWNGRSNKLKEAFYHISHGYKRVRVTDVITKTRRYLRVHRMVAELYLDNPNGYLQVNHLDGDKMNNDVSNLEWCDQSQNTIHAYEMGLIKDRGGWISHPYIERFSHANTEG